MTYGVPGGVLRSSPYEPHQSEGDSMARRVLQHNSFCTPLMLLVLARWCFAGSPALGLLTRHAEVQSVKACLQYFLAEAASEGMDLEVFVDPQVVFDASGVTRGSSAVQLHIEAGLVDVGRLKSFLRSCRPHRQSRGQKAYWDGLRGALADIGEAPALGVGENTMPVAMLAALVIQEGVRSIQEGVRLGHGCKERSVLGVGMPATSFHLLLTRACVVGLVSIVRQAGGLGTGFLSAAVPLCWSCQGTMRAP